MKTNVKLAVAAIAALCLTSLNVFARNGYDKEKFRSEKIAYITTELNLTPAEAEKFWPVYNLMTEEKQKALEEVMSAYKKLNEAIKSKDADAEVSKLTKAYIDANNAFQVVESKYLQEFSKVIPAEKVAKFYLSEEKFRRQQIHRLGKGRNGKPDAGDKKAAPGKAGKGNK